MDALGNDPEEDEVVEGVVADVVKAAVVFVCPYNSSNWLLLVRVFKHAMSIERKEQGLIILTYNTESSY